MNKSKITSAKSSPKKQVHRLPFWHFPWAFSRLTQLFKIPSEFSIQFWTLYIRFWHTFPESILICIVSTSVPAKNNLLLAFSFLNHYLYDRKEFLELEGMPESKDTETLEAVFHTWHLIGVWRSPQLPSCI